MFEIIKVSLDQGHQFVPDVRNATVKPPFRGFPVIKTDSCGKCSFCAEICPADAINFIPKVTIDLGKCVFCGECERQCPNNSIRFSQDHHLGVDQRNKLFISSGDTYEQFRSRSITAKNEITSMFGRSLKLRSVSAGGCNACEMELNAADNVNFDMERFGIEIVASPRHADGIVISGPISQNMAAALEDAYQCIPDPKIVIAMGSCAVSGGLFISSPAINRSFFDNHPVDIFLPGCPTHPLTFINAVLDFLDIT